MAQPDQLEDPRAEAAINWMVEIRSGDVSERRLRAFEAWLHAHPSNEAAWVHLQESLIPCGVAARQGVGRGTLTRRLVERGQSRRKFIAGFVGCAGAGAAASVVLDRFLPLDAVFADRFTLTGEQEKVSLADGSALVLSPRTAVDIHYEVGLRSVRLLTGEMFVRAAARSTPFQADIDRTALRTQAGAFLVERHDEAVTVTAIEGTGDFVPDAAARQPMPGRYALAAGDQIRLVDGQIRRLKADLDVATAWMDGLLVAKDRTLASVVSKIQPYFPGVIRVDPAVATLRVTGVFQLKDPNAALDSLAEALNVSVIRIARYWVQLGPVRA